MRLFLLPISTRESLIYCQRLNQQLSGKTTRIDRVAQKASATWLNWEKGHFKWQRKVTAYGNKLFERVPHEEWGLKSIPPLSAKRKMFEIKGEQEVRIEYPEGFIEPERIQETLERLGGDAKQAFHRKMLWGSVIGMPLTAPVALVPIIPNLPFIYLCFRAWSHWRARNGSRRLKFLLKNKLFKLSPSATLRLVYLEARMDADLARLDEEAKMILSRSIGVPIQGSEEQMLLSRSSAKIIADRLEFPEIQMEIERAVGQVEKSVKAP